MYTKYKYKHHTLIQVCIVIINTKSYSYTSMYTKYKYTYMSTILSKILYFNQLTSKIYRFSIKINGFVIIVFKIKCYMR